MIGINIEKLIPDIERIEKELLNSSVLVDNRIEPYYSLYCFKNGGYDVSTCFETSCPHVTNCVIMFFEMRYLRNGS